MKLYKEMARACGAYHRCVASGNNEWQVKWEELLMERIEEFPSGSGFDNGTKIDIDASSDEKLVFHTAFHHMNDNGMYDGWTEHTVTVEPSLGLDFYLKVSGRDRNDIKEYICEQFQAVLGRELPELANVP